jgi:hypothetical protein
MDNVQHNTNNIHYQKERKKKREILTTMLEILADPLPSTRNSLLHQQNRQKNSK